MSGRYKPRACEDISSQALRCPLCGARFPATAGCASGCPMSGSCRTVCCPHCHYRFVTAGTSTVAGWLERLLKEARP